MQLNWVYISHSGLQIVSPLQPLMVGGSATITCSTDLNVTSIEWLDSGDIVVESDTSGQQQLNLEFSPVNDSIHNAQYTCRITANGVVSERNITVTVQGEN